MADRVLPLDTFVAGDADIQIDSTQALRITAIGTDSGSSITPSIDGNALGSIVTEVGDIHPRNTAEQGLLNLGMPPGAADEVEYPYGPNAGAYGPNLYYYVPPDGNISLDGASGDHVRLQGQRLDGVSSRFESSSDETRYREQGSYHYTFEEGSVNAGSSISDGGTEVIHTISPASDERVMVTGPQMVAQTSNNFTTDDDVLSVFWELEGQRYPGQFEDDALFMIDIQNMPRPADDTDDAVPFVYGNYGPSMQPLTVQGDQDLDIKLRNTSGSTQNEGSGSDVVITYTAEVVFDERR